jgi:hypothetical protein
MKDYRQFNAGDAVVILREAQTGKVVETRPSHIDGMNAYMVEYRDGDTVKTESFMDWMLAAPEDTVYSVVVEDFTDDGIFDLRCDTVTRYIDYAKLRVVQLADDWRELVSEIADRYETEQDELSFSAWKDGYYNDDHYNVVVNAKRLE